MSHRVSRSQYNNRTIVEGELSASIPGGTIIRDPAGRQNFNTHFGEITTAVRIEEVAAAFQYNLATLDVTISGANSGGAFQSGSRAFITSSTNTNGQGSIQSVRSVAYVPGHEMYTFFTAEFDSVITDNKQMTGLYDSTDGVFIAISASQFGVVKRKNGNDVFIPQSQFNIDTIDGSGSSGFNLDTSMMNIYNISFGWLGASPIIYQVMSDVGKWIPFHHVFIANTMQETSIGNPVLPMRAEVIKQAGSTDVQLKTASWNGGLYGGQDIGKLFARRFTESFEANISSNILTNLITFRSKSIFQGLINKVRAEFMLYAGAADGTKIVNFFMIKDVVLTGSSFSDIDSINSVIEIDNSATFFEGQGQTIFVIPVAKTESKFINLTDFVIDLLPGETMTFAAKSAGASDVSIMTRWEERF